MTFARQIEEQKILRRRNGSNRPLSLSGAVWDGHRSVRVNDGSRMIGLATAAYSYAMTDAEKVEAAERIAALWNLAAAHGWTTAEINQMAARAAGLEA